MSWILVESKNTSSYILGNRDYITHYSQDVTPEMLNDKTRDFGYVNNEKYIKEYLETSDDCLEELPKGIYRVDAPDNYGEFKIIPWVIKEGLKLFELDIVKDVLADYNNFIKDKEIYLKLKQLYKRGVLLYGPPGTGKTSAINMILSSIETKDILVFYVDNALPTEFLQLMKHEKRLKIFIFEELTQTIGHTRLPRFLTFLDGEHSLDNCYTIATTNYPEQLPGNVVDRKGRFDELYKIDKVSTKDRKQYLEHFLNKKVSTADLTLTSEYPMASLKELMLLILRNGWSFKQACEAIDKHKRMVKTNFKKPSKELGFFDNDD